MTTSNLVPVPPNSIFGGNQYNLTYNAQANAFTVDGLNSGITVEWLQENFAPVAGSAGGVFSVGVASQPVQAPRSSQVATDNLKFAADTSTVANTITITLPLPTNTLVNGQPFVVQVANTNTGPTKLQILTAAGVVVAVVPVQSMAGALQGGELVASSIWTLRYNSAKKAMVVQGLGAGNPATQSNQVVTLGQFPFTEGASGYNLFGVPANGGTGTQYIQFGAASNASQGQYIPFVIPFPNGCNVIVANDTGAGIHTLASYPVSRFGMNVFSGYNGNFQGITDFQYIAIGW